MSGYGGAFNAGPVDPAAALGCEYTCGQCGVDTRLKPGEPIQCKECGYRILYKKRTKRVVQFEAR